MKILRKMQILPVIILLGLSGCGSQNAPAKNVRLTVVTPFAEGDGSHDAYTALYEAYAQSIGVTVEDRSETSGEAWKSAVIESFATGTEPDVLFFFSAEAAESFALHDKVVSLDEIRGVFPDYAGDISPGAINALRASDGNAYAVPVMGYWEGLFVNRDLFEANDIKLPETWDDLLTAVRRFNEIGIVPVAAALDDIPHYWFEFLVYNYTGPSGHMKTLPEPSDTRMDYWGKGLNDFKELYALGAFPLLEQGLTDNDTFALFEHKEAAMLIDGSWKVGAVTDTENVEVMFFPSSSPARRNTDIIGGFSMGFYITRKAWADADKREAAARFVMAMTSPDAISRFGANGAALPVSGITVESASPLLESIARMSAEATAFTPAVQDTFKKEAREYLFAQIPQIASGKADVAETLARFAVLNAS